MRPIHSSFLYYPISKRKEQASPPWSSRVQQLGLSIESQATGSTLPVADLTGSGHAAFTDATAAGTPAGVYEPILPSTETLLGMGLIVVLCVIVAWVWQNQVVPTSRTNLAISKSRGQVKEYLDELRASDVKYYQNDGASDNTTTLVIADDLPSMQQGRQRSGDARAIERWLFTDWLRDNKSERRSGRQKDPALPILKDAKWNSGDNPVLAATLLIGLGVIFTAISERVTTLISV